MTELLVTTPQASEATGATYRQIDYWDRLGIIRPAQPATGSGTRRCWTIGQAHILRVITVLASLGAQAEVTRKVAVELDRCPYLFTGSIIISPDGDVAAMTEWPSFDGWLIDARGAAAWVEDHLNGNAGRGPESMRVA